jgi:hypothetical protein
MSKPTSQPTSQPAAAAAPPAKAAVPPIKAPATFADPLNAGNKTLEGLLGTHAAPARVTDTDLAAFDRYSQRLSQQLSQKAASSTAPIVSMNSAGAAASGGDRKRVRSQIAHEFLMSKRHAGEPAPSAASLAGPPKLTSTDRYVARALMARV